MRQEKQTSDGERVRLLTRKQFVKDVFYGSDRDVGARQIEWKVETDDLRDGSVTRISLVRFRS